MLHDLLCHRLHNFSVGSEKVFAAHARFSGQARGDHHDIGVGGIFIIVGSRHPAIENLQTTRLLQVQRFSLRNPLDNINDHYVTEVFISCQLSDGGPNLACANYRDFFSRA